MTYKVPELKNIKLANRISNKKVKINRMNDLTGQEFEDAYLQSEEALAAKKEVENGDVIHIGTIEDFGKWIKSL